MKQLIEKIGGLIGPITSEKGELSFFALVLREDTFVWDLLVAAKWIDDDRSQALDYLVRQIQRVLSKQELLKISAVILLRHEYYSEGTILIRELGWEETDLNLYGIDVKKAYIFVAPDVEFRMDPVPANHS